MPVAQLVTPQALLPGASPARPAPELLLASAHAWRANATCPRPTPEAIRDVLVTVVLSPDLPYQLAIANGPVR